MISALNNTTPEIAKATLAGLVRKIEPTNTNSIEPQLSELEFTIVAELRKKLSLSKDHWDWPTRAKLLEYIGQELATLIIPKSAEAETRERISNRGHFLPSTYRIRFGESFDVNEARRGIRRSHVEETIRFADSTELIPLDRHGDDPAEKVAIFARALDGTANQMRFISLAIAQTKADILRVTSAWRIYPTDISSPTESTPLGWLRAFVQKYGLSFTVANRITTNFVLRDAFPAVSNQTEFLRVNAPKGTPFESHFFLRPSRLAAVEVAVAFVISTKPYKRDLESHGVATR